MTVAYFDESRPQAEARAVASPLVAKGRGFWGRALDRLIAAREKQAEREVARYRHFSQYEPHAPALMGTWHLPLGD